MKIPKPKKVSIKRLRQQADALFSKACFKYWGDKCVICKKDASATHHFLPKSISAYLRYELKNGVPLCYYDHIIRIHQQGDPRALEAIIGARGQDWYKWLKEQKIIGESKGGLNTAIYYHKVIDKFKDYLEF